ncbi:DUF2514 domain-containing protein [Pseudomonas sp. TKO26]|uniref:DUF2514 family protein n=1 Tax=unclassified Pseudomonas TaxID=196821 RepID=UPI000D93C42B|nr:MULTISPECIES: DUF2514 family protein [unclassified Pseudomonas]PYY88565.1 DUF2514 domain-containing protein [Pseudomonas sp. TKO30]PYY91425.1 DUF2514 domain-containing protein [Pseudomonas sp. TKO29]PYY94080.1 DUF2514 domain-containing protein [Pseudomonas sp. TKO26]PYZ00794.1 DUF2514 domain-containing protein [Pseudomonas sp. TKO14]
MNAAMLKIGGAALACLLLVALAGWSLMRVYDLGMSVKDAEWQARWNARDAGDKQAWALADKAEREKEQIRQNSINKAVQDGQRKIDQAATDAVIARAAAGSLQRTVDDLASRLAAQGRSNSCTAAASQAATRTALVLADLFKRADQRAGDLAADVDQSRNRGMMCEQVYSTLEK